MPEEKMVNIYIMNKQYEVPAGVTIMKAMEFAGYQFVRGCGCRGGFCGACGTVYRKPGDFRLRSGLACQLQAEEGMYLAQIPFYPANRSTYNLQELTPELSTILTNYPEVTRCLGCNQCTKICPQGLDVMDYIAAAQRGDIEKAAHMSFDCIMCGLCVSRCPAEIVHYNVGILCRRLYGRHIIPKAEHLAKRVEEIKSGKFDGELNDLMGKTQEELTKIYDDRDMEQ
ncbi:MAG: 4Fe-4S dicluster domain-containing protein [Firmicutes bacterium]|nr:4Fe-4S dicluster domain-containing protein [Bacillota bacterium]